MPVYNSDEHFIRMTRKERPPANSRLIRSTLPKNLQWYCDRGVIAASAAVLVVGSACTNDPYPGGDAERKILYSAYREAPKTLDPVKAYTTNATAINGNIYETLLEYHYLKRPYVLIPALATEVPAPRPLENGRVAYDFELRSGVLYQDDPCFTLNGDGRQTREVVASDVAFELMRIADPALASPVIASFSNIVGVTEFYDKLKEARAADSIFASLPIREQYVWAGPIEGIQVEGKTRLRIVLSEPYPQLLFWFAMPFTAPVPWEAVTYYDGEEGRPHFADHPVGAGPYRMAHYDKQFRIVLEKDPNWYGARHPEWKAPAATFPSEGNPGEEDAERLDPNYVGRALPFIERIEFRREKESIPRFNKFLQGYYDASDIIKESFDQVVQNDALSAEMTQRGMHLKKTVEPSVFYIGFNMENPVVGAPGGERSRKLRQAMSLVIDSEEYVTLFFNGRGLPAQSPIPPGIFGYDHEYRNSYRQVDIERAKSVLADAGYPGGIDPATEEPLRLTFDSYDTTARGRLLLTYLVDQWRWIGIDVRVVATNYNQFQEKVRKGAYQIFTWGWIADYPDPENFLFLLWSEMRRSVNEGPNTANFSDARYDELFVALKSRANDEERLKLIREAIQVLEYERPWIELYFREDYSLHHGWLTNVKPMGLSVPTAKYRDIDTETRSALRAAWNEPVRWPAYGLFILGILIVIPGIVTFFKERQ